MRSLLDALVLGSLVAIGSAQTTWYVDVNATPPGDGSQASPYVSIQQALDGLTGVNDTVLVAPGEYAETLNFTQTSVVVRATDGPGHTVLRPAAPGDLAVVTFSTDFHLPTLEGFTIRRDPGGTGFGARVLLDRQGRLVGCVVTGHAVGVSNGYDVYVERCTVTGNGTGVADGSGIGIHRISDSIVRGNDENITTGIFLAAVSYCDVGGPVPCSSPSGPCPGNFDADPLHWDAAGGDFHLRLGSPCIDAGDPAARRRGPGTRHGHRRPSWHTESQGSPPQLQSVAATARASPSSNARLDPQPGATTPPHPSVRECPLSQIGRSGSPRRVIRPAPDTDVK
jgi:hypothetical protein